MEAGALRSARTARPRLLDADDARDGVALHVLAVLVLEHEVENV